MLLVSNGRYLGDCGQFNVATETIVVEKLSRSTSRGGWTTSAAALSVIGLERANVARFRYSRRSSLLALSKSGYHLREKIENEARVK